MRRYREEENLKELRMEEEQEQNKEVS